MESKQTGRVILILCVLACAIFAICPQPWKVFTGQSLSDTLNLKPGIDMVGGTSLLYQIETPDGGYRGDGTLAQAETAALKRRIDPDGVKNYIWRPQGEDRIEIQIPASAKNDQATAARDKYILAQRALEATNVSAADVMAAVQKLPEPARSKKLEELAAGLPARKKIFDQIKVDADTIKTARQQMKDDASEATAKVDLDAQKKLIDATNLSTQKLETALGAADSRAKAIADFDAAGAGDPARLAAIAEFVRSYDAYHAFKGGVDDAGQLKRDLQGAGLLEFHIKDEFGDGLTEADYTKMVKQLHDKGPKEQAGDKLAWFQVDRASEYQNRQDVETFNDKHYVLCWIDDRRSMINGPGKPVWSMQHVGRTRGLDGSDELAFQFDSVGGTVFHKFTEANVGKGLAAILDKKIVSIANINQAIGADGTISGSYSEEDLGYMVSTLAAGSLPARLREEPISENTVGPQLGKKISSAGSKLVDSDWSSWQSF